MPRLSNEQREAFCRYYVTHWNATRAGEQAGYAPGVAHNLVAQEPEISARIRELNEMQLKANDITAERVMLELGRVALADVRQLYRPDGSMIPIHEIGDDAAAAIAGFEVEQQAVNEWEEVEDLITGEIVRQKVWKTIRTVKVKRFDKNSALTTLAKHYKIIGDEGDGINALASALGARLKGARERLQMVDEVPIEEQRVRVASDPSE
jgi:phage terminase small subunit